MWARTILYDKKCSRYQNWILWWMNILIQFHDWHVFDLANDYVDMRYIFNRGKKNSIIVTRRIRNYAVGIEKKSIGKNSSRLWLQGAKERTKDGYYLNFDLFVNLRRDPSTLIIRVCISNNADWKQVACDFFFF